jgi:hypothetical protein
MQRLIKNQLQQAQESGIRQKNCSFFFNSTSGGTAAKKRNSMPLMHLRNFSEGVIG